MSREQMEELHRLLKTMLRISSECNQSSKAIVILAFGVVQEESFIYKANAEIQKHIIDTILCRGRFKTSVSFDINNTRDS